MTLKEFALSITNDPAYRETVVTRARAGTLPGEIELFLWELGADGRLPMSADCVVGAPVQSRTLALVRPSVPSTHVEEEVQS